MTKSVKATIAVLLLLCVIIAAFPLLSIKDSEFGGADGAAEEAILAIDPDYQPWAESILEPPGGEYSPGTQLLIIGYRISVCRQHLAPVSSVLDSAIWSHAKNTKKTKQPGRRQFLPSPLFRKVYL